MMKLVNQVALSLVSMNANFVCVMKEINVLSVQLSIQIMRMNRIGRTGRFGKHGLAINLVSGQRDMSVLKDIETHFGKDIIKLNAEVGCPRLDRRKAEMCTD